MRIKFTKMHGAGNDFVMLDGIRQSIRLSTQQWRALADRHLGVGADQMLLVEAASNPGVDFNYRIFNADGGEVEHCGNGARCFVKFVRDQGLTDKSTIKVQTVNGLLELVLKDDGRVTVDMGEPIFDLPKIPFDPTGLRSVMIGEDRAWTLLVGGHARQLSVVSMGNPHAVQVVPHVATAPISGEGPIIEGGLNFPRRVNAGFMEIKNAHEIALRVWERGSGETLACGTGACAAVVAGIRRGLLHSPVNVSTRGGELTIAWEGGRVYLTGPATTVFEGEIEISEQQ
jgi:diaminopimelate epimerase